MQSTTHELFDEEDEWPRRLLHIPSMTSHRWEPGNVYGGVVKPKYNILSYTWGRWEDKTGKMPNAEPLCINGIGWPVPRIDSGHFNASQFMAVVQATAGENRLEYMWLDVACIDQTKDSPEMAREIGRQATIFRKAEEGFIWLNQHNTSELQEIASDFKSMEMVEDVGEEDLSSALCILHRLKKAHWFSSLWTLQESWINPEAIFLSKSSDKVSFGTATFNFLSVARSCVGLLRKLRREFRAQLNDKTSSTYQFEQLVRTSGFYALTNVMNPLGLLSASNFREVRPEEENNRVYGIMQALGFQLGVSAPDAPIGKKYTLADLEDQMGTAILREYPLISQLHVFDTPPLKGTGWRISRDSTVIYALDAIVFRLLHRINSDARIQFSVQPHSGRSFGYFKGATIAFRELFEACQRFGPRPRNWMSPKKSGKRRQILALDRVPLLESRGFSNQYFDRTQYVTHEDAHIEHCKKLLSCLDDHEVIVLLLGREMMSDRTRKWAVGVLLVKRNCDTEWSRVGVFIWFTDAPMHGKMDDYDQDILHGRDNNWTIREGLFG